MSRRAKEQMIPVRHGGLCLDVPDTWADQSTLLFVAPKEPVTAPLKNPVEQPTEAVSLRFVVSEDADADALLEEEAQKLLALDPEAALLEEGPFTSGLGEGRMRIVRLRLGEATLLQKSMACVRGPVGVVITAAAAEARFAGLEPTLDRILASLRPADAT